LDTEHLKVFVEVVQQGSFAAAARKFDIDPSVVTRAITALEKDLGLRLLERTTRQLLLTSAGKVYHESACKLLQDMQQAADEARDLADTPAGIVRVTTSVTYGYTVVLPMLPALREAYPALEIDLLLSDEIVDLSPRALMSHYACAKTAIRRWWGLGLPGFAIMSVPVRNM
jgi:DNA-binding transcriptional LysR family regulator